MELINQHTKRIMEGCKERARGAGLCFADETLEYIVTNRDLLELGPKNMIPTLYDYWVQDVEVLTEKGKYELYPHNPYETVINTRPAISFYNDNNPDWLNVMIFYHVLAHIDFFQNNSYFRHTWDFDLTGRALADKRLIARLRSEHGRWVDYVIEFARSIDNLVGYYRELAKLDRTTLPAFSERIDYYFDIFLQQNKQLRPNEYLKEVDRYNACRSQFGDQAEQHFLAEASRLHPELEAVYAKEFQHRQTDSVDLLQFLMDHSPFLNHQENHWMKTVLEIVRTTSIYFQPQIRTKILNEGWASYWHERLFLNDERIIGHEVDFARIHAGVTAMPRVGTNPYALGMRLFQSIEEAANNGHYSHDYQKLQDSEARKRFKTASSYGHDYIFKVREEFCDFTFLNTFIDQDFVDQHKLFVAGKRLDQQRKVWQYYVKSRSAEQYRRMLLDGLYHPPHISVSADGSLQLIHHFEGKPLVADFIAPTLLGVEYLWGGPVQLDTQVITQKEQTAEEWGEPQLLWQRVRYTMDKKVFKKQFLDSNA